MLLASCALDFVRSSHVIVLHREHHAFAYANSSSQREFFRAFDNKNADEYYCDFMITVNLNLLLIQKVLFNQPCIV